MAHLALYRRWRPKRFGDVVGQEHVTRTLRNAVRTGRTGHAYLFCGPRGTGKTSVARILAQALNCLDPRDGEPCGQCAHCQQVAADRFLDVQEIDAASHRLVEDMRTLREKVRYAAGGGRCKVYIVDEVHMLTQDSWNTLLKTLEEPPPATVFVLATTEPRKVPLTVLSRCQRFDFRRLEEGTIAERLAHICRQEGIAAEPEALRAIARRAEGGMRDALSVLDQAVAYAGERLTAADVALVLGAAEDEARERIANAIEGGDALTALDVVDALHREGRDLVQLARDLAADFRDRLHGALRSGAPASRVAWLAAAVELLADAEAAARRSAQPRLAVEVTLIRLALEAAAAEGASDRPPVDGVPSAEPGTGTAARAGETSEGATTPPAPGRRERHDGATRGAGETAPADGAKRGGAGTFGESPVPRRDQGGAAGSAPVSVEDVLTAWPAVLEAVRGVSRVAHAVFLHAEPAALDGRRLTLSLPEGYALAARKWVGPLDRAIRAVLGAPLALEFTDAAPSPGRSSGPEGRGGDRPTGGERRSGVDEVHLRRPPGTAGSHDASEPAPEPDDPRPAGPVPAGVPSAARLSRGSPDPEASGAAAPQSAADLLQVALEVFGGGEVFSGGADVDVPPTGAGG